MDDSFGHIIFQIGSNLYGLHKTNEDGSTEFDWDRFKKVTSFCRAVEIKLAQGAKQTGGILGVQKLINIRIISWIYFFGTLGVLN